MLKKRTMNFFFSSLNLNTKKKNTPHTLTHTHTHTHLGIAGHVSMLRRIYEIIMQF